MENEKDDSSSGGCVSGQTISGTGGNVENSPSHRSMTVEEIFSALHPSERAFWRFMLRRSEESLQESGVEQNACCGCVII